MPEKIFIGIAWPYANGSLHLGQIVSSQLPADILARYHRTKGNRVLMVSGSDQHGTPITVRAEQEGRSPQEVAAQFHEEFLDCWQRLGITFDLYTTTGTQNHASVTHDIFLTLLDKGHIYKESMPLPYCPNDRRFLPDRYVEGTCPYCGSAGARGDQCDECGKTLNAAELLEMRCRHCGTTPEIRQSDHFFLRLSAFNERLKEWVSDKVHWRKAVLNWTMGLLNEGLQDRAVTRDIEWGVAIPLEGYENKRIYVWFEAVIGYLSAAKEWAQNGGDPDGWREFWQDGDCKSYYFLGKDNIPFHTIIWPSMLMGYGDLNLPYDVPASQYLTMRGSKASTSRKWAVWLPDYLSRYDPDPLRYCLSVTMPETSDTDFTWADFVRRNNDELVATWGNLVHRVLTFNYRHFDGAVPQPGELDEADRRLLERAEQSLAQVGDEIGRCHFRGGISAAMAMAQEANRYLEEKSPWKLIRDDRQKTATALYAAIGAINALKTAFYPYMPFTCQRLHGYLGYDGPVQDSGWQFVPPPPGQSIAQPEPLFKKLEPQIVEEEEARLGQ
ncbi:MAG: methionine--tRNA ligase [Dehalococcoidia bacterium]|nr:MAG: methionine--tRNA ligase [Dehalococcoidia bacterium]